MTKLRIVKELTEVLKKYEFIELEALDISDDFIRELHDEGYIIIDFDEEGKTIVSLGKPTNLFAEANMLLVDTTNNYMRKYIGRYITAVFEDNSLYCFGKYGEFIFKTSLLKSYEQKDDVIKFYTLNSTYEFQLIKSLQNIQVAGKDEINKVLKQKEIFVDFIF